MPDTYLLKGQDGVTRKFIGDAPPTDEEQRQIEGLDVPPPPPAATDWTQRFPKSAQLLKAALDTLPAVGGMAGGALSTPETFGAGTIPGIALGAGAGRGLRDLIGEATGVDQATSPLGKAARIAGDTAMTGATAAVMPGAVQAIKSPIQTLQEALEQFGSAMPPAIRRLGNLLPTIEHAPAPSLTRPPWQSWPENGVPAPAKPLPTPSVPAGPLTGPSSTQLATDVLPGAPTAADLQPRPMPAPAAPVPGSLTAAEKANLLRTLKTPDAVQRLEQQLIANAAKKAPVAGVDGANAAARAEQEAAGPARAQVDPALQASRLATGAERVGAPLGLSKDAIRAQTAPILGEAQGAASPVVPENILGQFIDKMRAMGPGSPARTQYVQAASDPKTMAQLENLRRTLERLGLVAPVAVGGGIGAGAAMTSQKARKMLLDALQSYSPNQGSQ